MKSVRGKIKEFKGNRKAVFTVPLSLCDGF